MSVATAVYEQTCHVCDAVRLFVMRAFINMQRGRQLSANQRVIRQYMHIEYYGYKDPDLPYHLNRINDRTNEEYDKKLAELK